MLDKIIVCETICYFYFYDLVIFYFYDLVIFYFYGPFLTIYCVCILRVSFQELAMDDTCLFRHWQ